VASEFLNPETFEDGSPIWAISGYTDERGNYHDFTQMSEAQIEREYENNFFVEVDTIIIEWFDAEDGSLQHSTLIGPFDDIEDLDDHVDTYFEEGTP
jgi:hypothetical protein